MMRRRMAQMNARMNPGMNVNGPGAPSGKPAAAQQPAPVNTKPNNNNLNNIGHGKPGVGGGQPSPSVQAALEKVNLFKPAFSLPTGRYCPVFRLTRICLYLFSFF